MNNNNKKVIQFSPPDIGNDEINLVIDALKSGWITTGPKTKDFEKRISDYCHTEKSVAMNSCTAAMEMTLRLLDIGPGDEVITSAYTYTASASVIAHVGAKIILIDTQKDSTEMDYDQLAEAINERTKAIIPVDIAGIMCDYDKIFNILDSKNKFYKPKKNSLQTKFNRPVVIADAAHSFGARYKGKPSGEVADFTCFSFHAVKNLTTAEGGAVTWRADLDFDHEQIYTDFMLLVLHGQNKDALAKTKLGNWEYDIIGTHYKCNMTDIQAALGLAQLERYENLLKRRRTIIESYNSGFSGHPISYLDHYNSNHESSGHLYLMRIDGLNEYNRNQLIVDLAENRIATNVHYKPLPMHTAYKKLGFEIEDYPNAFAYYENEISLPLHTLLTDEDVTYIINTIIDRIKSFTIGN